MFDRPITCGCAQVGVPWLKLPEVMPPACLHAKRSLRVVAVQGDRSLHRGATVSTADPHMRVSRRREAHRPRKECEGGTHAKPGTDAEGGGRMNRDCTGGSALRRSVVIVAASLLGLGHRAVAQAWRVTSDTDAMTDDVTLVATLPAVTLLRTGTGQTARPELEVLCTPKTGTADVALWSSLAPDIVEVEPQPLVKVELRMDRDSARTYLFEAVDRGSLTGWMHEPTDLSSGASATQWDDLVWTFLPRLAKAHQLLTRYTLSNGDIATVRFVIPPGSAGALNRVTSPCGYRLTPVSRAARKP